MNISIIRTDFVLFPIVRLVLVLALIVACYRRAYTMRLLCLGSVSK